MQFFKFDGILVNQKTEDYENKRRREREEARKIYLKSMDFNKKVRENAFYFVSMVGMDTAAIGVISQDSAITEARVASFLKAVEIDLKDTKLEEITLNTLRNMLQQATREDFIDDDDEVLDRFGLDKLLNFRYRNGVEYEEKLIKPCEKEEIYHAAERLLSNETFLPELDRIYAGDGKERTVGHPVHYIIETDDNDIRKDMSRLLLSALHEKGRLRSKRYCVLDFKPGDNFSKTVYEYLYKSSDGGTIVVRFRSDDDTEDDHASSSRETIESLCETMKKYRHQVLTIFCLPRECTSTRDIFYEYLGNISIIELKEELAYGERAEKFLKTLAKGQHTRPNKELLGKIEQNKGYLAPELHDIFDDWYSRKLKTKIYPQYKEISTVKNEVRDAKPKGSAYDEFMEMTGLSEAKKVINQALTFKKAQKLFADKGMRASNTSMHMVFTGNPGTAKTSVARLFARIMRENNLLSKGQLIEVGRGDLVGKYVGWTAPTIQKKFKEAQGSVLFIDEAYSLVDDRSGSYGDEAINTIVQEMENHRDDVVVIFAGYPNEMEKFLQKNPGLRSRIAYHVAFCDYNTDELCEIAHLIAKKRGLMLSDDAAQKLISVFDVAKSEEDFGNGRYVRNVIEKAEMARATRLLAMDYESVRSQDVMTICAEDIEMPSTNATATCKVGFRA